MLTVEKRIISRNFTRAGAGRKIEYIVIHYFGSLGTAYFSTQLLRTTA